MDKETFIREIDLGINNDTIKIHQNYIGDVGCVIWDAAMVLARYLIKANKRFTGLSVVELGSGTGVVGIVAAYLGANVCITDLDYLIPLMMKNVEENKDILKGSIAVEELKWGTGINKKADVILVADCVYYEESIEPLVKTLSDLCTEETEILFCYEERKTAQKIKIEERCLKLLDDIFSRTKIGADELDPIYNSPDIHLYRLCRKQD